MLQGLIIFLGIALITFKLLNKVTQASKFQILGELINHVEAKKKVVALTYDDGPNPPYTNQLVSVLDRLQIKATFFVIGKNVEQHPETVQLLVSKGHELGNHSYSHTQLVWKTPWFVRSEIEKTDKLLRQLGVTQEIHFRAPYGLKLLILPYLLSKMHKKNIMWSINPRDFAEGNSEVIENYVIEQVRPGSIILMHDGGGDRSPTIAATEGLIQKLREQGYQFKTVSELMLEASSI